MSEKRSNILLYDIHYDTDGEDVPDLPWSMLVIDPSPDFDLDAEGADLISDETGWCVFGFKACEMDPIAEAIGWEPDQHTMANALMAYGAIPVEDLQARLQKAEATFAALGGRGVEQADTLDALRIALAARGPADC